ncbi:MAG TPA: hypothetical protein VHE10_01865 [Candidatus Paceibacterota bacterium]|nr:hypothetical protein [Candidatus Paceibacterota bacterium]
MDPENTNTPSKNEDLQAEGIDIVGTSRALDNEFDKPEIPKEIPVAEPALDEETEPAPVSRTVQIDEEPPKPAQAPVAPAPSIPKAEAYRSSFETAPQKNPFAPTGPAPIAPGQNDPSIKPIRTYRTDAEEAVKYGGMSKIGIAVAEQNKRDAQPIRYEQEKRPKTGLFIGIVIILILFIAGGWYIWFSSTGGKAKSAAPAPTVSYAPIVPYSQASIIVLDPNDRDNDPLELMGARLNAANPGVGNVFALIPVTSATAASQEPVADVFDSTHIPSRLLRSLGDQYMVGLYSYDKQVPFIILKNTFFQNAFSGMLDWERDLGQDMMPLIRITYPEINSNSLADNFDDVVISNTDVRTLKDTTGRLVLAYAFADKDTIIVTTSENGLKFLLDRILQVRTIQ